MRKAGYFIVMILMVTVLIISSSCNKDIRRTVTEEEWNKNMNAMNYEYSYEIHSESIFTNLTHKRKCKCDTDAFMEKSDHYDFWTYTVKKNGIWYRVEKNLENGEPLIERMGESYTGTYSIKQNIALESLYSDYDYSQFVFDEEKGAYTYIIEEPFFACYIYLFFENGDLARVEAFAENYDNTEYKRSWIFVFKNINNTVVDVPEFSIE